MAVKSGKFGYRVGDTNPTTPTSSTELDIFIKSSDAVNPTVANSTAYMIDPAGGVAPLVNGVSGVSNADGTLTISPTTGAVVASRAAITSDVSVPAGSNVATIASDAVTNTKLADMAQQTFKMRAVGAGTGDPIDGTSAQATAALDDATFLLPGRQTAIEKISQNSADGRNSSGANKRVFRPGDYMVGNVYDPTGSTTSTAFDAMMTAVIAFADRAEIQIPAGVFKITTGTLQGFSNASLTISGPGRGVCVLIPTATGDFIKLPSGLTGGDGFTAKGFTIYNTSGTSYTTGAGINVNGCDNVMIEDVGFVDLFYDVHVNGAAIKVSMQKLVSSSSNADANSVGILVDNGAAGDTYIGPDIVMSCGGTRRLANVQIKESGHYEITQCNLTSAKKGILINPAAGKIVAFGFHTNVLCDSNSENGMLLDAATSTSTIKNIKSVNSWYSGTITGGTSGAKTTGVAGGIINGLTFTTDRFLNNQTHGFEHTFGTDVRWSDCDMKGNNAVGAGAGSTNAGLNVAAAVSDWSINGGKYGGTDTIPTAANQDWGIVVAAGAGDNIKISPDSLSGNRTGPISMGATGVAVFINGCPGLAAPYARGTASGVITTVITIGNLKIPKNSVRVGATFRLTAQYLHSGAATAPTFTVRLGATNDAVGSAATNGIVVSAVAATGAANAWGKVEFIVTVSAIGGGGNVNANGSGTQAQVAFGTATAARASGAGLLAFDTTADRYLTLALTMGVAGATVYNTNIEVVNY